MRLLTATLMLGLMLGFGLALASSASADDAASPPKAGRFTMVPAEGGFVRLDTETGIVSHCRREGEGDASAWHCAAISEDVLSAPDRVTALKSEVEQLRKDVTGLRLQIAKLTDAAPTKPPAPPITITPPTSPPSSLDTESDRELNFSEELMRRFFGMIREMKHADQPDRT